MRKAIVGFLIGGILGVGAGFAIGIFVYPYIFLADIVATEKIDPKGRTEIAKGDFIHANPSDPIHWGKGSVTVYGDAVFLNEDFQVGPGPKYHVYLVPDAAVTPQTKVAESMYVDLGRLRAFQGSQSYAVPPGTDVKKYGSVVIWCEQFSVLISPAKLSFATK